MRSCVVASTRKLNPDLKQKALHAGIAFIDRNLLQYTYEDSPDLVVTIGTSRAIPVFTSIHAVHAVKHLINRYAIRIKQNSCYCISGATEQQAKTAGFEILASAPDSHKLADIILQDQPTSLIHYTSNIRIDDWKTAIHQQGMEVKSVEVYHKSGHPVSFGPIDGAAFFSPSQIELFLKSNQLQSGKPAFCIGPTTAAALGQHQPVLVATEHSEKAMIELIIQYYQQQHES